MFLSMYASPAPSSTMYGDVVTRAARQPARKDPRGRGPLVFGKIALSLDWIGSYASSAAATAAGRRLPNLAAAGKNGDGMERRLFFVVRRS